MLEILLFCKEKDIRLMWYGKHVTHPRRGNVRVLIMEDPRCKVLTSTILEGSVNCVGPLPVRELKSIRYLSTTRVECSELSGIALGRRSSSLKRLFAVMR